MEVTIGLLHNPREITIEVEQDADAIATAVAQAQNPPGILSLTDKRGHRVLVPATALAYVEIGTGPIARVGFSV